ANETERKRFEFEAEAAAQLEHPNIIPIHEVGEHEGRPFFSLSLIEGGSLANKMGEGRGKRGEKGPSPSTLPFLPSAAAHLVSKIARAVHFATQRGITPRDLKPSNILLDHAGEPHVTDFGLAKAVAADGRFTVTEAVLGSPYYMSPEQAAGKTRTVS